MTDVAKELIESVLAGDEPDWDQEPEPPATSDERAANRLLRRWRTLTEEIADANAIYDDEIRAIEEARSAHVGNLNDRRDWLVASLKLWHQARLAEDPTRTQIKLPQGTLVSRAAQDVWTYEEEAAFVEWAKTHAKQTVHRPPRPEWTTINKNQARKILMERKVAVDDKGNVQLTKDGHLIDRETGEAIPGIKVSEGGDHGRFYDVK